VCRAIFCCEHGERAFADRIHLVPVNAQDAQNLADSWGIPYIECSSKTGENVAQVFHTLLKEIEKDDGLLAEAGDGGCTIL